MMKTPGVLVSAIRAGEIDGNDKVHLHSAGNVIKEGEFLVADFSKCFNFDILRKSSYQILSCECLTLSIESVPLPRLNFLPDCFISSAAVCFDPISLCPLSLYLNNLMKS